MGMPMGKSSLRFGEQLRLVRVLRMFGALGL